MKGKGIGFDLGAGAILTAGLSAWLAEAWRGNGWPVLGGVAAYTLLAAILAHIRPDRTLSGWANRVTLLRAVIVCSLAGALIEPDLFRERAGAVIALTLAALALDGLDGWLARRFDESSAFGARFDMETDAALILVLCAALWLSGLAPAWVLAIGLMRPVFVLAGLLLPWLSRPLPDRFRRKLVCVVQVGALPTALLPFLPEALRATLLAGALLALTISFALDTAWLFRHRRASQPTQWRMP
ncbi:CDP-alcohol phosphatidyltransferase family protein [Wenzhouxiangella sediminis]|jgi:phosphatidylglycerophosphate synthase|nr:CDP-alcohol phosphatidyltransferase family protein [Wenzhouxiangella sediminis]